eukprot:Skav232504  [mRNA]  locus=scaffold1096:84607:85416:+ [translate_table: standard]
MARYENLTLVTVSLDYVIDADKGDVSKPATQRWWLEGIFSGLIVGVGVGPPCQTWSRVRNVTLLDETGNPTKGPRVLRQADFPWGKASLRIREVLQLTQGNVLLGFALQCLAAVAVCGRCGFLEHPLEPNEEEYVSIWKLPITNLLAQLPGTQMIILAQGLLGSETAKPTQLLTVRLPSLLQEVSAARLTEQLPQQASVGRNQTGGFKTTSLKEYPPAFCRALARSIVDAIVKIPVDDNAQFSEALMSACEAMQVSSFGETIGRDFHQA